MVAYPVLKRSSVVKEHEFDEFGTQWRFYSPWASARA